jgi:hypothetical protein
MPNKRRVNLSLSDEVVDELSEEDNMSGKVEQLLREDYGLSKS